MIEKSIVRRRIKGRAMARSSSISKSRDRQARDPIRWHKKDANSISLLSLGKSKEFIEASIPWCIENLGEIEFVTE